MSTDLLRRRPITTVAMLAIYGDGSTLGHALAFEAALARSLADARLIDEAVAERIATTCATIRIDPAILAEETAHAGTLAIPLVLRLRAELANDDAAAQSVHRGATSQDLADTVMMLQARDALTCLQTDLGRIVHALGDLATRHARTAMIGRTLLQDARPVTFGLRAAQWLQGFDNARHQLERTAAKAILLQFGGAVGTRAGLAGKGSEIATRLGALLGLKIPSNSWHSSRENVAALAAALGIVIGSLGKIARDVSLLAQDKIGELKEPLVEGRGGSSSMPHKRNPAASQVALSAAIRAPGLVAGILGGLPQELERGLGGWQAEGPALADLFMLAGGSAEAIAAMLDGLEVDVEAMARNLAQSGLGDDNGEAAAIVEAVLDKHRSTGRCPS